MSIPLVNRGLALLVALPLAALGGVISLRTLFPSLALVVLALTVLIVVAQPSVRCARISPGQGRRRTPGRAARFTSRQPLHESEIITSLEASRSGHCGAAQRAGQ